MGLAWCRPEGTEKSDGEITVRLIGPTALPHMDRGKEGTRRGGGDEDEDDEQMLTRALTMDADRGTGAWRRIPARLRAWAGDSVAAMALWMSAAAAAYWLATLVPSLAVFALTGEIADRPGGGPYTTKALLSIARAAALPVGFALALLAPVRRAVVDGWRRPVALVVLPLVYSVVPNVAFALTDDVVLQMAGRFAGSLVVSLAFCAYLAYAQGRRASDVTMPVVTLAMLLSPCVSRPLSLAIARAVATNNDDGGGGDGDGGDGGDVGGDDGHQWMPLAVSVICIVPTVIAAMALAASPPPTTADALARAPRLQGSRADDRAWLRRHWGPVLGLAACNTALQGIGAVRDVFTADLLGVGAPWWHSVVADVPACAAACAFYVPLLWVHDNRAAFLVINAVGIVAGTLLGVAGFLGLVDILSPLTFLVVGGVGHFFALVPFSGGGIVFERLIAASDMPVDSMLVNVACQVPAYVGALGVLLLAPVAPHPEAFFEWTAVIGGGALVAAYLWLGASALRVLPTWPLGRRRPWRYQRFPSLPPADDSAALDVSCDADGACYGRTAIVNDDDLLPPL